MRLAAGPNPVALQPDSQRHRKRCLGGRRHHGGAVAQLLHLDLQKIHRRGADGAGDKLALRLQEQLHRRADLLDKALLQHHDLGGKRHRLDLIMGHIDLGGEVVGQLPADPQLSPVICSRPATMRSKVDLPQPEGPTKTQNSPSAISISTPLMIDKAP